MATRASKIQKVLDEGLSQPVFDALPARMLPGFYRYVLEGIKPGDFLTSVFENNLCLSAMTADYQNVKLLSQWAVLVSNYTPSECHGSHAKVQEWMKSRSRDHEKENRMWRPFAVQEGCDIENSSQ
jgi:hypothetical protein